jgi:hypothetical protein
MISMVAERACAQGLGDLLDAGAGVVQQVTGHGQDGKHDGQVGLDGLALVVEHGPARRSPLVMRNACSALRRSW